MDLINNFKIQADFVKNLKVYRQYNKVISEYFYKMSSDKSNEHYKNLALRTDSCNRVWHIDYYKDINIKELKKTHLCKNKFCFNCKKILQAFRMAKYSDLIRSQSNIYHLVLTIPSVHGDDLGNTLKKMSSSFRRLYGILNGRDKFKLPFDVSCLGALRSLEITFNDKGFHPHYHVLLVFDEPLELDKDKVHSKYSYSYSKLTRTFSDFELYIQKLWYCIFNDIRLTNENIENTEGYSCILDEFKEDDFIEIFKYLCKEADFFDIEDDNFDIKKVKMLLPYRHFVHLYEATYRVKQLQGYGVFYHVTDNFDVEELHNDYDTFIEYLTSLSDVKRVFEYIYEGDYEKTLDKLKSNNLDVDGFKDNFKMIDLKSANYISFKNYVNFVSNINKEE